MPTASFTLAQLELFVAITRAGTLTAAAERVHISQPAASAALAELERRLDVPLFERVKGRLMLTAEGERFAERATLIVELAHEAQRDPAGVGASAGGILALGASTSIGNYVLPGPLCAFQRRFPRVRVRLTVDITERIVDGLEQGHYPVAFIEGPAQRTGVHVERFAPDELVVVLPPSHPLIGEEEVDWERVAEERLILRSAGGTREVIERTLEREGLAVRAALEFGHTEAIKTAVALGEGVSILSRRTCAHELAAGTLGETRVRGVRFHRWLYRIQLEGRRVSPLTANFLSTLLAPAAAAR